jgi:hypothetical protein
MSALSPEKQGVALAAVIRGNSTATGISALTPSKSILEHWTGRQGTADSSRRSAHHEKDRQKQRLVGLGGDP